MLVPKLRFKREDGTEYPEWEEKRVGEILTLCHGKDYKHLKKGDIPVMGTGGVITYVNEALCDWQCVCIGRKGTIDRPYFMDKPFWSVDTLFYSKPVSDNMPKFQYYLFQNINWQLYNEASGVPSLSASTIENVKVKVPDLEEQQKIANFLSTVDEVIAQSESEVQNLEQQKKAAMQKIFSQEVRFKREDGTEYPEWEQYRLEDTVDFLDEKRKPITSKYRKAGQYPYYGASGIIDFIDDYIFDEELVLLSEDGANIVDRNYRVAFIATGKYWVNNHAHCLRPKQGFASYFISEALESIDYTVYNTGSAQPKLNQEVCRNLPLMCPCLEEQQKIADFLSAYDEAIRYAKQELDKWKELKKGLLQQMFV